MYTLVLHDPSEPQRDGWFCLLADDQKDVPGRPGLPIGDFRLYIGSALPELTRTKQPQYVDYDGFHLYITEGERKLRIYFGTNMEVTGPSWSGRPLHVSHEQWDITEEPNRSTVFLRPVA